MHHRCQLACRNQLCFRNATFRWRARHAAHARARDHGRHQYKNGQVADCGLRQPPPWRRRDFYGIADWRDAIAQAKAAGAKQVSLIFVFDGPALVLALNDAAFNRVMGTTTGNPWKKFGG